MTLRKAPAAIPASSGPGSPPFAPYARLRCTVEAGGRPVLRGAVFVGLDSDGRRILIKFRFDDTPIPVDPADVAPVASDEWHARIRWGGDRYAEIRYYGPDPVEATCIATRLGREASDARRDAMIQIIRPDGTASVERSLLFGVAK